MYFEDLHMDALTCRRTTGIDILAITRANRRLPRETLPFYYCCVTFFWTIMAIQTTLPTMKHSIDVYSVTTWKACSE